MKLGRSWLAPSAAGLGEHGIEHLHDELLLRARQLLDAFDLPLQHRCGAALSGGGAVIAQQLFDGDAEQPGQLRQRGNGNASAPDLVGVDGLLRDAQGLGQLHLGDGLDFALFGDAGAESGDEGAFCRGDGHGEGVAVVGVVHRLGLVTVRS